MTCFKKVFLSLIFGAIFIGCSGHKNDLREWMEPSSRPHILSTTTQIGDLVTEIGGDRVFSLILIQGDLDPHSYELVKGDGEKIFRADLVFYNGLGLEHGASLAAQLRSQSKAVALGEEISRRVPDRILQKGEVVDPHLWMDVSLWKEAVPSIVAHLSRIDPEGALYYQERGSLLDAKMEKVHQEIKEMLHKVPSEKRYLITSHDAFRYFAKSYLSDPGEGDGPSRFTAPEGLAPDGQLSSYDFQRILDFIRLHRVSVLFPESNVSRDSIKKISIAGREFGLEIRVCSEPLYGDATSGLSYLDAMWKNGDVISRYLL